MNARIHPTWLRVVRLIFIAGFLLGAAGFGMAGAPRAGFAEEGTIVDNDQDRIDDAYEQQLMTRFAPELHLHPCEDFLPASVEWYLDRVFVSYFHEGWTADHHYDPNPIHSPLTMLTFVHDGSDYSGAIAQQDAGQPAYTRTDFFLDRGANPEDSSPVDFGQMTQDVYDLANKSGTWPVYVQVRRAPISHLGMIDVQYWFFYPKNGPMVESLSENCDPSWPELGMHQADWEHITVRVRPDGQAHAVWYGRHSDDEGRWYKPGDYPVIQGTDRPIVYVGWHSHANYTFPGNIQRGLIGDAFLPDDHTAMGGTVWDTSVRITNVGSESFPKPGMQWLRFTGLWGAFCHEALMTACGEDVTDAPPGPAFHPEWWQTKGGEILTHGDGWDPGDHSHPHPVLSIPILQTAIVNQPQSLLGFFTDSSASGPWTATVNWGDGTESTFSVTPQHPLQHDHTYRSANLYYGWIEVSNGMSAGFLIFTVAVIPSPPLPGAAPPEVSIVATPDTPEGLNGWYDEPVTVDVQAKDDASGVLAVRCALDPETPPLVPADLPAGDCPFVGGAVVTSEGVHTLYAAALNNDFLESELVSFSFKIDTTPPFISCDVPPLLLHSGIQAVEPSKVYAMVSGLDAPASTLTGAVSTDSIGPQPATFTAVDLAGHETVQTCNYNVVYDFGGFYLPLKPFPALNEAQAGSAVPLKFSLAGDQGMDILAGGPPAVQQFDCEALHPLGDASPASLVGNGLRYDAQTGWYSLTVKTDKSWAGTCQVLTIVLADGTEHETCLKFK